jgi:LysM repeat protein
MTTTEYYIELESALKQVDLAIVDVENSMSHEYENANYVAILNELNATRRSILKMLSINKYMRISKEAFLAKSETSTQKIDTLHTVKQFETPIGIAVKYNMRLEDLLKKNNITTADIVAGIELKVEIDDSAGAGVLTKIYEEIPTFGSQEGLLVLGKDVTNELKYSNGDLTVLMPEQTVAQGILNRVMTNSGDYPYENDFGVTSLAGSELPNELIEGMALLEIESQIKLDKRISSIEQLTVTRNQNAIAITGILQTINNITIEL